MSQETEELPKPRSDSPETNAIIELALAVHEGNLDRLPELKQLATRRHQEMEEAAEGFFGEVDQQGEEFFEKFRPIFEEIERAFSAYEAGLVKMLEFEEDSPPEAMDEAARILANASFGIRLYMNHYEEAYLAQGPSKFPAVNMLSNLGEHLRAGRIDIESWKDTIAKQLDIHMKAIEEIDKSEHKNDPFVPERRAAMEEVNQALRELDKLNAASPEDKFAEHLASLSRAFEDLKTAFDNHTDKQFAEGPTDAPNVNWVIHAARGVQAGTYPAHVLKGLATGVLEETQKTLHEIQLAAKSGLEEGMLSQEVARLLEAMEGMEDALSVLVAYSEDQELPREEVDDALSLLEESGNKLAEARDGVKKFNETAGQVSCVQCGASNPLGSKVCEQCQAAIPQLPGSGVYGTAGTSFQVLEGAAQDVTRDAVMTDVMKALFDKCEAFYNGEMPAEIFLSALEEAEDGIDAAEVELRKFEPPPMPPEANEEEQALAQEFIDLASDALDLLNIGLDECREGIDLMRRAATEEDVELMKEGIRFYYEGTQKMWQVRRLDKQMQAYLNNEEIPDVEPSDEAGAEPMGPSESVDLSTQA